MTENQSLRSPGNHCVSCGIHHLQPNIDYLYRYVTPVMLEPRHRYEPVGGDGLKFALLRGENGP